MKYGEQLKDIEKLIDSNPIEFMQRIKDLDLSSIELAEYLDSINPHAKLREKFDINEELIPFAGHSLGPVFIPGVDKINQVQKLQSKKLHAGHFSTTGPEGGNWYDCDIDPTAIAAIMPMLNCHPDGLIYTHLGLTDNLIKMLSTFYRLKAVDWNNKQVKICCFAGEFCSDQIAIHTAVEVAIDKAHDDGIDVPGSASDYVLEIPLPKHGEYDNKAVIDFIRQNAHQIKLLHLSTIMFNTSLNLHIPTLLQELGDVIRQYNIIVGLDLAHQLGNRPIDLNALPMVTYAVSCGYKFLSGLPGAPGVLYVNPAVNLEKSKPIQGWKAADSQKIWSNINRYAPEILYKTGAKAFRASNPNPIAILPVQEYVKTMYKAGWDKLMSFSESQTMFLLELLSCTLGDKIEFISQKNSEQRGAMLVFSVLGLRNVHEVEKKLNRAGFDIDTRPPNNIRVTAHYGYTRFVDIVRLVKQLKLVIDLCLQEEARTRPEQVSVLPSSVFKPDTGIARPVTMPNLQSSL